jgi:hypothetical protein
MITNIHRNLYNAPVALSGNIRLLFRHQWAGRAERFRCRGIARHWHARRRNRCGHLHRWLRGWP